MLARKGLPRLPPRSGLSSLKAGGGTLGGSAAGNAGANCGEVNAGGVNSVVGCSVGAGGGFTGKSGGTLGAGALGPLVLGGHSGR